MNEPVTLPGTTARRIPSRPHSLALQAWILLFLCFLPSARGVESGAALDPEAGYSFEELYSLGLEHNLELLSSRLDVDGLRWDRLAAAGTLGPGASFNLGLGQYEQHTFSFMAPDGTVFEVDDAIVSDNSGSRFNLSLNQTLFQGFSRVAGFRKALLLQEDVLGLDQAARLQFRQDLKKSLHAVMTARALLEAEESLLQETREQHRLTSAMHEIGSVIELDVLQTEINVGRQLVNVESARQDLASSWDAVTLLLGVKPCDPPGLAMSFQAFEPAWTEEQLVSTAREHRQDVLSSGRARKIAGLDMTLARSEFLPTLTASLSHTRDAWRSGKYEWKLYPEDYTNSVNFNLSLPLFQGFSALNNLQHSRADRLKRELEHEQLLLEVRAAVRESLARLRSAWTQSRLTEKNRDLARRSLDLERKRYKLGMATLLNVQTAESTYRQAETEHLSQLLAFHDRLADLELAVGRPLVP